jgi:UDP-N-acetylglucosamine 3-dehydrogenase
MTTTAPIRTIIVGAGRMGKNHLRVLREHPRFKVVEIVDPVATGFGDLRVAKSLDDVTADFELAVIASTTATHAALATQLIERGKHVLVEKPLAATSPAARELHALATRRGVCLAIGHVERLNPAVRKLRDVIASGALGKPIHFSFTRVGGYPAVIGPGNNVVLDLAVHDVDVFSFLGGPAELVSAVRHSTVQDGVIDTATLLLRSQSGVTADVHVNWITPTKIRQIRVTGTRGVCFVDYMLQTCELYGGALLTRAEPDEISFAQLQSMYANSDKTTFGVQKFEPLVAQANQLAKLIREGERGDLCGGDDAVNAVAIAEQAAR